MTPSLAWLSALIAGFFSVHGPYVLLRVMRYGVNLELFKLRSRVHTVLDRFIQQAQRVPDKPFVIYEGSVHTYRDIERRSNRLAHVFLEDLLFKYDLIKYDMVNDEPVKDQHGFCQTVKKGETGLLLSKVSALSPFFGYAGSKQLTERKLMRNVFVKGDAYFNTGDLMAEDQEGFISFRDRVGDTFRWKGENVATTEVTETLGLVEFIQEVNVYGVEIKGHEGRAGMAAMIIRPGFSFDGSKLFEHVMRDLPAYARPLFIRLQEEMEMTSTFKQHKFQLVQSGFNPSSISDLLYVLDHQQQSYIPLTDCIYHSILAGERKL
ncbi:hypothetical protein KUCAC02_009216 [Chaenocephalus aceratus]|uniref:Uncharacterized protein n=1 Tax=Chaenocephalus aceratus TaxID=36190 RepID=A0ACB9WSV1_CHAAC|nr:hypothetical protein KUCAC02_009216 [Chaenocephalus aceratus]